MQEINSNWECMTWFFLKIKRLSYHDFEQACTFPQLMIRKDCFTTTCASECPEENQSLVSVPSSFEVNGMQSKLITVTSFLTLLMHHIFLPDSRLLVQSDTPSARKLLQTLANWNGVLYLICKMEVDAWRGLKVWMNTISTSLCQRIHVRIHRFNGFQ